MAPPPQSSPLRRRNLSAFLLQQHRRPDYYHHQQQYDSGTTKLCSGGGAGRQQEPHRRRASTVIPSLGFSGAGFLACYHLGVVAALREHHQLLSLSSSQQQQQQRLAGVSGGALVAAAVVAGVSVDDGMEIVLQTSRQAHSNTWDALQPGFSLIDSVEPALGRLLRESIGGDEEAFLKRVNNDINNNNNNNYQSLLWIGLTDRRRFLSTLRFKSLFYNDRPNNNNTQTNSTTTDAFFWVHRYRSVDDVVAACILSSYIPFVTGPVRGNQCPHNPAVARAAKQLHDMIQEGGCVVPRLSNRDGDDETLDNAMSLVAVDHSGRHREIGWDGGLVDAFPVLDHQTVVVSPVAISHSTNAVISPALEYNNNNTDRSDVLGSIPIHPQVRLHVSRANARVLRCLTFSSEDDVLHSKFAQGYDNATQFLRQHSLLDRTQHVVADSTRVAS